MSLKRSRYDIVSEILELSNTPVGVNITKVVYSVNLNFKNAQEIISELIFKGMLEVVDGGERVRYRTTKKGLEFLSKYKNLVSF
jgi:predicted transcriptional regulator